MCLKKSKLSPKSLMKSKTKGYVIKNDEEDITPKGENEASDDSSETSTVIVVLFMLFGCAPSTSLRSALWCELAWFEASQPEGVAMGSWFALMEAVGALLVICIMYVDTFTQMPRIWWTWGNMFFALITCFILALTWSVTIYDTSVFLYYGMVASMIIGEIRYTLMIPWLVRYFNPRMVSPFYAGGPLMTTIFCIMAIIQQPGGIQLFSPTVFFLLTMIMYLLSVGAGIYIFRSGIQRREDEKLSAGVVEPWRSSMALQYFPPGWPRAIPYASVFVWNLIWSSWLMPVFLPYASDNTTPDGSTNSGENYLQWAMILTYAAKLVGSLASHYVTEKFFINELSLLSTVIYPVFILAAVGVGTWTSWGMKFLLMAVMMLVKGIQGWWYPLTFRAISKKYPEDRGPLSRFTGLWAMTLSIPGLTVEWWLIYSGIIRAHH